MKTILLALGLMAWTADGYAQKYITRSGKISFFSATPIENIEAFNNETAAVLDAASGEVVFQVPVKSFKFDKQLMQDHFNEDYMESDKYPKALFKGHIKASDLAAKDGVYKTTVKGQLTIHGTTKDVTLPGTITLSNGTMTIATDFTVAPSDYNIKIPAMAASKIAGQIQVTVNCIMKKI